MSKLLALGSISFVLEFVFGDLEERGGGCRARRFDHFGEVAVVGDLFVANILDEQPVGLVELPASSLVHHEDPVRVDDRRQSMRNNDDRTILENLFQFFLDEVVGFQVDVRCGLIEHEDLGLSDDGSGEAEELLLSHREDVVIVRDHGLQAILAVLLDVVEQFDLRQDFLDLLLRVLVERVEILPDRTLNQEWCLGNVGDVLSEEVEANLLNVGLVDCN